jgi:adenylate cyclase
MTNQPARKLTVILHADVIGSTALVQQDESLAHSRIVDAFKKLSRIIQSHGGIPHEIRGDALLAEFSRASDAVTASMEFQQAHRNLLENLEDSIRPEVRLGISMGEVIIADSTMTGAGVVMAQRLEQLAVAGGLVVQGAVYETLPKRLPFNFQNLGKQKLKGFDEPVEAYRVIDGVQPEPTSNTRVTRLTTIVAAVSLLLIVGAIAWFMPWRSDDGFNQSDQVASLLSDQPSIAVLPFDNLSNDAQQEYFADGLTEDLITDLSKVPGLFVIARNSVFTYKDKSVKVSKVAADLGVRYVLEGSVRRSGNQVRINAQLIDATTSGHIWAERYDGLVNDIFAIQDQVNQQIINSLSSQLINADKINISREGTESAEAHDAFLKGWDYYRRKTPENHAIARDYFEQALGIDPGYNRVLAALASLYWDVHVDSWSPALKIGEFVVKDLALDYLERALNNPTPLALVVESRVHLRHGRHDQAVSAASRAVELSNSDSDAQIALARALIFSGHPEQSLPAIDLAVRIDPHGEAEQKLNRGLAEFGMSQFENAKQLLARAFELNPNYAFATAALAATYGHLKQKQKALAAWQAYVDSEFTEFYAYNISTALSFFPYKKKEDKERLAEGWRFADLPESEIDQYK